jgi:hypothetical protein
MRRSGFVRGVSWFGCATGLAAVSLVGSSMTTAATSRHVRAPARAAAAAGVVLGGLTAQGLPVVIEVSKDGRHVVRASIAIRLRCTVGGTLTLPDSYGFGRGTTSRKGTFRASFGPQTTRNDDGTTLDLGGTMRGAFNAARSKAAGTWRVQATGHTASGAVTTTCDSRTVRWRAKQ